MKFFFILLVLILHSVYGQDENIKSQNNVTLSLMLSHKNYFCTLDKPIDGTKIVQIENMGSVELNRQVICYKCCVADLPKEICSKTPFIENYNKAKSGKNCGCKNMTP